MNRVLHSHRCGVAWLVGHRHINRIEPRPWRNLERDVDPVEPRRREGRVVDRR